MKRVFQVRLWPMAQPVSNDDESYDPLDECWSKGQESDVCVTLDLPAKPYELLDAMDQLRLNDASPLHWKITSYHHSNYVITDKQGTIFELNALAQRLSTLDKSQSIAYVGLQEMEFKKYKKSLSVPISRLIDLAYSTHCCRVITEARNDDQLGRFYVQNGLIPEAEGFSDTQLDLLNYERIGREKCQIEGGVFVKHNLNDLNGTLGYVTQTAELVEVYKDLDLTLRKPDYALLLRVSRGYYASPAVKCKEAVQLELPATPETLKTTLSDLGVKDWHETVWRGLDCCVPILSDKVYDIGVNDTFDEDWMNRLNNLSQKLADMEPKELNLYKALLEINGCQDIQCAEQFVDVLDQYIFSSQFSSPIEVAQGELALILAEPDADMIIPYLDMDQYGEALIQKCGGVLTSYGLIERKDGQPVQSMEEQPQWGGMEMT